MSSLARVGALVAAGTLVTTGLVSGLTSPAVAASTDPRPVAIGASWLEGQLTDGLIHNPNYGGFDDYGLSIDTGLSLIAVGGHDATVSKISSAMATHAGDYTAYPGHTLAGSIAKLAGFALAAGDDPTSFGGHDLVSELEARVASSAPIAGRIQDAYTPGPYESDFANLVGQAFAARVLSAKGTPATAGQVVDFLIEQQCAPGYFRLNFNSDPTDPKQTCDDGVAAGDSAPDTDATAMAVLQLQAISTPSAAVTTAIGKAEAWLLAAQHTDGSFGGGASTEAPNTNSTGLAGWALGVLGDDAAARKAATWVRAHQADNPSACADRLSDETGAIGYDDAGVAAGRVDGITSDTQDQWRRSTAPTLPVLQWAPQATSVFDVAGPRGFVKARSAVTFRVTGAAPGSTLCLSGAGAAHRATADATGAATIAATMPRGTAVRVLTAAGSTASDTASVRVLGARTFKVRPSRWTVHRGGRVHVVVRGLVRGERVVLRVRGVKVRVGTANARGRFVADVRVGHRLGKARIVARGQFPAIRHGRAVVHVVR